MLRLQNIAFSYSDTPFIRDISFSVGEGEFFGILGPNGCGKSTLLKLISCILTPAHGEITLEGKPISAFTTAEFAERVAVLPQQVDQAFSFNVYDTVALGRYAHQKGWFKTLTADDKAVIEEALIGTGLTDKRDEETSVLSGGEKQRVFLAKVIAQQPKLLLLDEPTNHMDISYQLKLLDALKCWAKEKSWTIIAVFHDLNLASLYCDRVLLMNEGQVVALDEPKYVLHPEHLQPVYDSPLERHEHPSLPKPLIALLPQQLPPETNEPLISWQWKDDHFCLTTTHPFKTLSSALIGGGMNWCHTFINRHVSKHYDCLDPVSEMRDYLAKYHYRTEQTIGMMTAVYLADVATRTYDDGELTVTVVVTAGVGNAVDVARAHEHNVAPVEMGTINTFLFIKGQLSDAAFVQAMMTATEAKTKALAEVNVLDRLTKTVATGTSTDSIVVAASQTGATYEYAGTMTLLGQQIGRLVVEATVEATLNSQKRAQQS